MRENSGKRIKHIDNWNLRMVCAVDSPARLLFDQSAGECAPDETVKELLVFSHPSSIQSRATLIKHKYFMFLRHELETFEAVNELLSGIGNFLQLSVLQKGNVFSCCPTAAALNPDAAYLDHNVLYFKSGQKTQRAFFIEKGEKVQYITLLIDKGFIGQLLRKQHENILQCELYKSVHELENTAPIDMQVPLGPMLYEAISSLFEMPCEEPIYLQYTKLKLVEILLLIKHNHRRDHSCPFAQNSELNILNQIKTWIGENYTEEFTLKSLSRTFGLNELALKNGFRNLHAQTIRQYVIELRMKEAKQRIIKNEESVKEIAYGVGYKSVSHFISTYKKHYGITPKQQSLSGLITAGEAEAV